MKRLIAALLGVISIALNYQLNDASYYPNTGSTSKACKEGGLRRSPKASDRLGSEQRSLSSAATASDQPLPSPSLLSSSANPVMHVVHQDKYFADDSYSNTVLRIEVPSVHALNAYTTFTLALSGNPAAQFLLQKYPELINDLRAPIKTICLEPPPMTIDEAIIHAGRILPLMPTDAADYNVLAQLRSTLITIAQSQPLTKQVIDKEINNILVIFYPHASS